MYLARGRLVARGPLEQALLVSRLAEQWLLHSSWANCDAVQPGSIPGRAFFLGQGVAMVDSKKLKYPETLKEAWELVEEEIGFKYTKQARKAMKAAFYSGASYVLIRMDAYKEALDKDVNGLNEEVTEWKKSVVKELLP
jgi:hypothetical protein